MTFTLSRSGLITFACKNLMGGAARVSMSDDTDASRHCFGISVTPIFDRQNSSERLSANFVFASATFSGPSTLLIRTFVSSILRETLAQMVRLVSHLLLKPLQTSSACHSSGTRAVGTQTDVHVLSTSQKQSLDVLRFPRGCGGRDVL